ncbi:MAG: glycoside hydrolase family 127 protein [Bacteroidetes bacterium]|nr:glycoside hydrolase family 127 protein [Bacteroidota bacterium]
MPVKQSEAQVYDAFQKKGSVPEAFQPLPFFEVVPLGWIKEQIQENLNGFTGHLDSLVPDLIIRDDIYGKDRLSKHVKAKDVGAITENGELQSQFLWWNSETQSNWRDGYIRSAILTMDQTYLSRAKGYIRRMLTTQDTDGYLGIYDKDLRYKFDNENGELWAKTTLLRGMLAWYYFTRDFTILKAIEAAVGNVMVNYPAYKSYPFHSVNPDAGGLTHGLAFTDVLEELWRITGKIEYRDYCLFLYNDFSEQMLNEDAQYSKLMDTTLPLKGHGAHTYEHLRALASAFYASANPKLKTALKNFLGKISHTTTASGGPVGDEWIAGRKADATGRGYEYCSIHELLNSYTDLLAKTGDADFGELTEKLFFNAAQGARNPFESSIAYLKTDNSYSMCGGLNGDTTIKTQTRYKYSPVHQDVAACCVPNAGRIAPYYVQSMWMKDSKGLIAVLLGPCEVETNCKGKRINIEEQTAYPYEYSVTFIITAVDSEFDLKVRRPSWAKKITVSEEYSDDRGYIVIHKRWQGEKSVSIQFFPDVQLRQDLNGEYYYTYGPLVLARPIQSIGVQTKTYPLKGFRDMHYRPLTLNVLEYANEKVKQVKQDKLEFTTVLYNPVSRKTEPVILIPIGQTILRQVTFKPKSEDQ